MSKQFCNEQQYDSGYGHNGYWRIGAVERRGAREGDTDQHGVFYWEMNENLERNKAWTDDSFVKGWKEWKYSTSPIRGANNPRNQFGNPQNRDARMIALNYNCRDPKSYPESDSLEHGGILSDIDVYKGYRAICQIRMAKCVDD